MSKAIDLIKDAYFRKMEGFPSLSYGYLAKKMDISSSLIGKFFKEERSLHPEKLTKLCKLLEIDLETQDIIYGLILNEQGWGKDLIERGITSIGADESKINRDSFQTNSSFFLLEKWYYLPCLEATLLKDFTGNPDYFSQRIGLSAAQAKELWARFIELKLVEMQEDGVYRKPKKLFRFDGLSKKELLTKFHIEQLNLIIDQLKEKKGEKEIAERLVTAAVIPCSQKDLARLKFLIGEFLTNTVKELADPQVQKDQVYQLSVQAIALTNSNQN